MTQRINYLAGIGWVAYWRTARGAPYNLYVLGAPCDSVHFIQRTVRYRTVPCRCCLLAYRTVRYRRRWVTTSRPATFFTQPLFYFLTVLLTRRRDRKCSLGASLVTLWVWRFQAQFKWCFFVFTRGCLNLSANTNWTHVAYDFPSTGHRDRHAQLAPLLRRTTQRSHWRLGKLQW
jgi:hypothetical protein